MQADTSDSRTNPQLQFDGYAYLGVIVLAFCALASQKLVHYPIGFMAIAGIFLFISRRSDPCHTFKFLLPSLFGLLWLPMFLASIDAVAMKHSLSATAAYLHFLPAAYFVMYACPRPGVYFWLQKWILWLTIFIIFDALLQFFSGYNLLLSLIHI